MGPEAASRLHCFFVMQFSSAVAMDERNVQRLKYFVQQKYFKLFFGFVQKLELSGENIHRIIGRILGYVVPKTCMLLYFGNRTGHVLKEDRYLLKSLLVACKKQR